MRKGVLALIVILVTSNVASAQKESFLELSNRLLCNAYVYGKTDSTTFKFLKQYFPYLTTKPPEEGWFIPPIGVDSKRSIVSLTMKAHPFFDFKTTSCQLDFKKVETGKTVFEDGCELWLTFDNKMDAEKAFKQIANAFKKVGKETNVQDTGTEKLLKLTEQDPKFRNNRAELSFKEISEKNYTIHFVSL